MVQSSQGRQLVGGGLWAEREGLATRLGRLGAFHRTWFLFGETVHDYTLFPVIMNYAYFAAT